MDEVENPFNLMRETVQSPELDSLCVICGNNHNMKNCDYINITEHIADNPIPTTAKLSLPNFLEIQTLSDGSYHTVTKSVIAKGTQFGPFHAEKIESLEPSVTFPLKIFTVDQNTEYYLNSDNESKCSWLMYVRAAETYEEQNLICYQKAEAIYYTSIKDIEVGDSLKVWYAPYYAQKMNKPLLVPKSMNEDSLENIGNNTLNTVDVNKLIKTQQKIKERNIWRCKFCSQVENNVASFAKHIWNHYSAQHKNICEICNQMFGSKKILKSHMRITHHMLDDIPTSKPKNVDSESKKQCNDPILGGPLLNNMFADSTDFQPVLNDFNFNLNNQNLLLDNYNLADNHFLNENVKDLDHFNFEIDDSQKQFSCDICFKQFNKMKLLITHLRHHSGDFMCPKCLKIFCRKENLTTHSCNMGHKHTCHLCNKKFTQKKYLSRHLIAHHERKFLCSSCNKHFYSNKELSEHNCSKVPVIEKEKFICPICDKKFYRNVYLRKHLKLHAPSMRHKTTANAVCDICGLHFKSKNSCYNHRKKHQKQAYSCEFCGRAFHRIDYLKEHYLTHQNNQVECDTCKKKFSTRKVLNQHVKIHQGGIEILKCPKCDRTCKQRKNLNRHLRLFHSADKDSLGTLEGYKCPICNKSVKLKSSIQRHLRRIHKVSDADFDRFSSQIVKSNSVKDDLSGAKELVTETPAVNRVMQKLNVSRKTEDTQSRNVSLSIPDLTEADQEITLDTNAYILENGAIVQPLADSDKVVIYVLDRMRQSTNC